MRFPAVATALSCALAALPSAQGRATGTPVPGAERPIAVVVPAGTELDVKIAGPTAMSSATLKNDQRFEAATLVDVTVGGVAAVPAGSIARGFVSSFKPVSVVNRQGSFTLSFDELRVGDRSVKLRATVLQVFDPNMSEDLTRIGPAAVTKGASGGIIGTGKAPLTTVFVTSGVITAAQGGEAKVPAGAVLRIRIDQPIQLLH
ncbi:MAG TPA: hypothetical protein VN700_07165 [Vicinamibacterales bacterium]|nr:hypothetical protein [Vicinamibacterales bacterium]